MRIVSGDQAAENAMVERYHHGLIVMLFNRCSETALAEDVAQDTWLLVLRKVRDGELRDTTKLGAFIMQIGRNQLIMKFRSRQKNPDSYDDEVGSIADQSPTPDQILEREQFGSAVIELLSEMTKDRDKELLKRFYLVGDDKTDICRQWELDPIHFDRVLYRARERFKNICEKRNFRKKL